MTRTTTTVDPHLVLARKAARESLRHLKAAIRAARGEERIRLQENVLEELLEAIAHLEWNPPRPAQGARRAEERP
jgi:hypothetical protein